MTYNYVTIPLKKSQTKKDCKKFLTPIILSVAIIFAIIVILCNPKKYSESIINGFLLFANAVFPGLFPFLILTKILTELGLVKKISMLFSKLTLKLFKVPGIAAYVFLMAALCGYPMGAKLVADLHEKKIITTFDAQKILSFSSVCGPIFTIGTIGAAMLNYNLAGAVIFISHLISALICGLILCNKKNNDAKARNNFKLLKNEEAKLSHNNFNSEIKYDSIIAESVYSSISTILIVGAYITVFFMFIEVLISLGILNPIILLCENLFRLIKINPNFSRGFVCGLIEMTRGTDMISKAGSLSCTSIALCCGVVSFGGLSINMQCLSLAHKTNINAKKYILAKLLHMVISLPIAYILASVFGF